MYPCEECAGAGTVHVDDFEGRGPGYVICQACGGRGKVAE